MLMALYQHYRRDLFFLKTWSWTARARARGGFASTWRWNVFFLRGGFNDRF